MSIISIYLNRTLAISFVIAMAFVFMLNSSIGNTSYHEVTVAQIKLLEEKLWQFNQEMGRFPTIVEGLETLKLYSVRWNKYHPYYLMTKDVWGQKLIYIYPARYGNRKFDLYSSGANGKDEHGKEDDISNWSGFDSWYYERDYIITKLSVIVVSILALVFLVIHLFSSRV